MNIPLLEIIDLVAISLGEYPDWKLSGAAAGMSGCSLSEPVKAALMPAAMAATESLTLADCTCLLDMRTHIRNGTDWGNEDIYPCELPDNFLRLHSFRMRGWPHSLSEENPGDSLRRELGENAPEWLLKRSMRPFVELIPANSDSPAQIIYGPATVSEPEVALYVPRPVFVAEDAELTGLQPKALPALIDSLAKWIASEKISFI